LNPDPSAIPFLRALIERHTEDHSHENWERSILLEALFRCGGLSEEEGVDAIQAFALWSVQHRFARWDSDEVQALPLKVGIGMHLSENDRIRGQLAAPLLKRARSFEIRNPTLSETLRKEVWSWPVAEGDGELIRRLTSCEPLLSDLQASLFRRTSLVANHKPELDKFAKGSGWRAALASVLLEDTKQANDLLVKGDDETRLAVLASARMRHFPLDFGKVALFALKGRNLALAADRYLKAFEFH
jgi:hypothetical protein